MLKKLMKREEGFTLAELLIVVAIIAVLVAISIPIFTTQLERSREATDLSNIRSAYAEAVADYLAKGANTSVSATVSHINQTVDNWQTSATLYTRVDGKESKVALPSNIAGKSKVTVKVGADGKVEVTAS